MIRHCVLVRPRADLAADEMAAIFEGLAGLRSRLPGMLGFVGSQDVSPEGMQRGYLYGFTIDFTDAAARDAYLADAEHKALGGRLTAAAEGGRQGLIVVDIEG